MLEHVKAGSVETKILSLLRKNRFALSEQVAMDICVEHHYYHKGSVLNSHWVTPIQNKIAKRIGIDEVPDPNGSALTSARDEYERFMELYTSQYILKSIHGAVNDSTRLINYHDFVEYLETQRPADVDSYEFLNHFVFDMDTGKFRDDAIKFALSKMKILKVGNGKDEPTQPPATTQLTIAPVIAQDLKLVPEVVNEAPIHVLLAEEFKQVPEVVDELPRNVPQEKLERVSNLSASDDEEFVLRDEVEVPPRKKSIFARAWNKIIRRDSLKLEIPEVSIYSCPNFIRSNRIKSHGKPSRIKIESNHGIKLRQKKCPPITVTKIKRVSHTNFSRVNSLQILKDGRVGK